MKASLSVSGILLTHFSPSLSISHSACVCLSISHFMLINDNPVCMPESLQTGLTIDMNAYAKMAWFILTFVFQWNKHFHFHFTTQIPKIAFNWISSLQIKHLSVSSAFVRAFKPMFCCEFMINDELSMFTLNRPFVEQHTMHNQTCDSHPASPIQVSLPIIIFNCMCFVDWKFLAISRSLYPCSQRQSEKQHEWIRLHYIWRNSRCLVCTDAVLDFP